MLPWLARVLACGVLLLWRASAFGDVYSIPLHDDRNRIHSVPDRYPEALQRGPDPFSSSATVYSPDDRYWANEFGLPRPNGPIECAVEFGGKLVIGGSFSLIGEVAAHNIAAWDGTRWSELGGGIDGRVRTLFVYQGDLVVGGSFSKAGSTPVNNVARWSGTQWTALGDGLGDPGGPGPSCLAEYRGALIAGGEFDRSGSYPLTFLARWTGSTWLGEGDLDGPVFSLATLGDTLFAGGYFRRTGYQAAFGLARFDGIAWSAPPPPLPADPYNSAVRSLTAYQGKLAVGATYYLTAPYSSASGVFLLDGNSWDSTLWDSSFVYQPAPNTMLASGDSLIVGSAYGLIMWSGASWWPDSTIAGDVRALTMHGAALVAAGELRASTGSVSVAMDLVRRSGGSWEGLIPWSDRMHGLIGSFSAEVRSMEVLGDQLIACGYFNFAGDPPATKPLPGIGAWNGSAWDPVSPIPWGAASALLARSDTLYASGHFYDYGRGQQMPVVLYEGQTWSPLDTLPLYPSSMAFYRGELYVAGQRSIPTGYRWEIHRLAAGHWERVAFASGAYRDAWISSMVEFEGRLVVAGSFDTIGDIHARSVAAWDGSSWTALDSGLPPFYYAPVVRSLAVHRGSLVGVIDPFSYYSTYVMEWTRNTWKPLGQIYNQGLVLASAGGDLYLGGRIYWSQNQDGIARWDGRTWEPLGSGTGGDVLALKEWNGSLFVGGNFRRAGTNGSFSIARWDGLRSVLGAPKITLAPGVPNPFRSSSAFSYRTTSTDAIRITVIDIRGRQIAVLDDRIQTAGDHTIVWNGKDDAGNPVATGIYFVRIQVAGAPAASRKAILLR